MNRGWDDCNITPVSALKSPTSTIVQARILVDDRVNVEIDNVVVELNVSFLVSSVKDAFQLS